MNARALRRLQLGLPNDVVVIATATFTPRSDINEERIHRMDAATSTVTLSNATGAGTQYWFVLGIAAVSMIWKTNGTDVFQGLVSLAAASGASTTFTAAGTKNVTFNGGTTGGVNVGDEIIFTDQKAGVWNVQGFSIQSGGAATPFS